MELIVSLSIAIVESILCLFFSFKMLNYIQLSNYRYLDINLVKKYYKKLISMFCIIIVTNIVGYSIYFISQEKIYFYITVLLSFLIQSMYVIKIKRIKTKTPLVFTKRMMRLICLMMILLLSLNTILSLTYLIKIRLMPCYGIVTKFIYFFLPFICILALKLSKPIEDSINKKYIENAKQKLEGMPNLISIGITGSYGKTSVKFILLEILKLKFNVACTPSSYNTPLGIALSVNNLKGDEEIFIAEMGARNRGDIKELAEIIKPTIGIITGITSQHIESFKSIDNIIKTKNELVEFIQDSNGFCVFNNDNQNTLKIAKQCISEKVVIGKDSKTIYAENIRMGKKLEFDIVYKGKNVKCSTRLLGLHSIDNILLATAVALKLKMELNEIADAISYLKPIPHRLDMSKTSNGINIIDDSYNSNEEGVEAALEVLNSLNGRKIICACGYVELGKIEKEKNFELGQKIAKVVDIAILVGKRGVDIKDGMISCSFSRQKIYTVNSLDDAKVLFSKILITGDNLLIENDLPDNYE